MRFAPSLLWVPVALILMTMWEVRRAPAQCEPAWQPEFEGTMFRDGSSVNTFATFDDGTGLSLYAAGSVYLPRSTNASVVARRVGTTWVPVGTSPVNPPGLNGAVNAMISFNDGGGPALYVAGNFSVTGGVAASRIARWTGTEWQPVGAGFNHEVYSLAVYDDGNGPALYAGGGFTASGTTPIGYIAKWTGGAWMPVGGGVNGEVRALEVYDLGPGERLYAGGTFRQAGSQSAEFVASWNGLAWSALGGGVNANRVYAIRGFVDGSGPGLCVAGDMQDPNGNSRNLARWTGTNWISMGPGLNGGVRALAVYDDGTGPSLFAAGEFVTVGGSTVLVRGTAKWSGSTWLPLGEGLTFVDGISTGRGYAMAVWESQPGGPQVLYVGGHFLSSGPGIISNSLSTWNGLGWALPASKGPNGSVSVLKTTVNAGKPEVYCGGGFNAIGTVRANLIARWDGLEWSALGGGLTGTNAEVKAIEFLARPEGTDVIAAGRFTNAGGLPVLNIARWNGTTWASMGLGFNLDVNALAIFDDGLGGSPALFAAGQFTQSGPNPIERVARWTGSAWVAVGSGLGGGGFRSVNSLVAVSARNNSVFGLYAGGTFVASGTTPMNALARWDGVAWNPVGNPAANTCLAAWDDGSGLKVYAGGVLPGGDTGKCGVYCWNGATLSPVGGAFSVPAFGGLPTVSSICPFDDGGGTGPRIHVAGRFINANNGTTPANSVASWTGSAWISLAAGVGSSDVPTARSIAPGASGLAVGGTFDVVNQRPASSLAQWGSETLPWVLPLSFELVVPDGSPANLTAIAGGPNTTFQWRRDGVALSDGGGVTGSTTQSMSLASVVESDAGAYDVVVSNPCGSVRSTTMRLVVPACSPRIEVQPLAQSVPIGQNASLHVVASFSGSLSYQWRRNGLSLVDGGRISGAQSATLVISQCNTTDAASYDVLVSCQSTHIASDPAALAVCLDIANSDSQVNTIDLLVLLGGFGQSVPPTTSGDADGNGVVNLLDLVEFLAQFGRSCPS